MKIYTYAVIMIGITLFLQLMGISTGLQGIFTLIGVTIDSSFNITSLISSGTFWSAVFGTSGIFFGIIAGVAIGIFFRINPESYIILPLITGTLVVLVQTFTALINYNYGQPWIKAIVLLVFAPLSIGYLISCVEFFRGSD